MYLLNDVSLSCNQCVYLHAAFSSTFSEPYQLSLSKICIANSLKIFLPKDLTLYFHTKEQ